MGFYYVGPIDGHDIDALLPVLQNAKDVNYDGPIMIHIKTQRVKAIVLLKIQMINIMEFQNLM